ncbi:hypothetical protein SAMN05443144_101355 [Fodinibius roseus]|uniref:Tetratricopeptide repeat-containing protein n=1 Tax=Fodinibius roseus TaxID=1194090 RepID=A0A1M4TQ14_9BACT|nr:tetratricopeptide repeat protein [Fodinibius roseus]SHE46599.1 hypothetical protein SAMN05443144_101355 [Fodinibius roseus]
MLQLPFKISRSLSSYAEHFDENPVRATQRLKKQLKKRGPDAVGYFLLAWFYHLRGMHEEAVEEALRARIFAPGSSFFQKLHYYLSHPRTFEAWTPDTKPSGYSASPSSPTTDRRSPVLDLDSLIQKLSDVKTHRITPKEAFPKDKNSRKKEGKDTEADDIVSETLAKIHEKQGKIDTAIRSYQQLKKIKKDKSDYFDEQISRLREIKRKNSEEE